MLSVTGRGRRYPLPPGARIGDLKVSMDEKSSDAFLCKAFSLTERQIRRRFQTYRELGPGDEHNHYAWYPCRVSAAIRYRGRTFYVDANMANTMWTNWPDGRDRELGGIHDGELSD